ncbi:dihydrodipicolinate synthase family protein [Planctobacterium marinum]|uniref:Dihydrodipicolinate synthase family protein n=1 Tax=Planctobacterium marinum TaxID=1631968 RepID=A0AA48KSI0_9ALTE|nr:dihydrodipicolinate synthase family protein [Planctobacterium marinum]
MFTGLSAFPLTPFKNTSLTGECIDFRAFERLIKRLTDARVDSICAMGSTGLYSYLSLEQKRSVAKATVELAGDIPVMAGIGALRTADVLKNAQAMQQAGVKAVLLAPVSYHPLQEHEVYALYETVCNNLSVPLCVYENPGVTQFSFSDDLYQAVARLPNVAAVKIPGTPFVDESGSERLQTLRTLLPEGTAIGVSGDKFGTAGMAAGCDLWLSVVGGLFPKTVLRLISSVNANNSAEAQLKSQQLQGLWSLFVKNKGGMRVMATAAAILGICEGNCLPAPLQTLGKQDRTELEQLLKQLALD